MTREILNELEVRRLCKLSRNTSVLYSYLNKDELTVERSACEIAIKSAQWDIEDAVTDAISEAELITDRFGIADTKDVSDMIRQLQYSTVPDILASLRCIQQYEKMPRMDDGTSVAVAENMCLLIKGPQNTLTEKFVDKRILDFLTNIFTTFLNNGHNANNLDYGNNGNNGNNAYNANNGHHQIRHNNQFIDFRISNFILSSSPNTPFVASCSFKDISYCS